MMDRVYVGIVFLLISLFIFTAFEASSAGFTSMAYQHSDMGKVVIQKDIIYKMEDNKKLKLDIYYPPENIISTHTVVLIHGNAPISNIKDTELYQSWGKVIAASGFTVVAFNWRPFIAPEDIADLVNFIRKNEAELKINKDRITFVAFSAGVEEGVREVLVNDTGYISSIVVYYGKIDQSILDTQAKLPPMFIAMGALDSVIPVDVNADFIKKAREKGCEITLVIHPYGRHGFENFKHPETDKIIEKTITFISKN